MVLNLRVVYSLLLCMLDLCRLLVRLATDDPTALGKYEEKFGCSVSEACTLVQTAKQLNLNIVGVWYVHQVKM